MDGLGIHGQAGGGVRHDVCSSYEEVPVPITREGESIHVLYSSLHLISNHFRSLSLCIFAKGLQSGGELFKMPSGLAVPLILFSEMTS